MVLLMRVWIFCFYFFLFFSNIIFHHFFFKKEKIDKNSKDNSEHDFPEIIENEFILIDKKYTKKIHTYCPENWTNDIVWPKIFLSHPTCSSNKWDKRSCEVMKLSENDIPKAIFRDLFFEYFLFCFSESDIVSVFFYDFMSVPFTDPVAEIVSEHCSDTCETYRQEYMIFPPKSSYENHDIHTRHGSSDDRKWLDTGRCKCYKKVPVSESLDQFSYPFYTSFYPFWMHERNANNNQRKYHKKYGDSFCEKNKKLFQCMHETIVWKSGRKAKKSLIFYKIYFSSCTMEYERFYSLYNNLPSNSYYWRILSDFSICKSFTFFYSSL